jgi:transcriptional regulator with XRE-family HTH domain
MGRTSREKPARLADKLLRIREALELSQSEILSRLGLSDRLNRDDVSKYERGAREPSLPVLLRYARAVNISTDVLIDDELDLPARLPAKAKRKS